MMRGHQSSPGLIRAKRHSLLDGPDLLKSFAEFALPLLRLVLSLEAQLPAFPFLVD